MKSDSKIKQTKKSTRGGAREGAGRPATGNLPKLVRLSPANLEWLQTEAERRKAVGEVGVSQSSIVDELVAAARLSSAKGT